MFGQLQLSEKQTLLSGYENYDYSNGTAFEAAPLPRVNYPTFRMRDGPRGKLKHADAGKIGERAGRVVNKRKMAKHFTLEIADQSFSYRRNQAQIDDEALLDGIYVLRTAEPHTRIGSPAVVRAYKQLKVNERAFGR